jgi:FtsP/CotA-like multicopper oxidase with cupredoxin domain
VTEFFDPNESFVDKTGTLVDRYVLDKDAALIDGQCRLDLDKEATWKPCYDARKSDWWDVFAIPAARVEKGKVIPGYFKMRTRFVDYHGLYVMHCHILIHEDHGMMFRVEVLNAKSAPAAVGHH